MTKELASNHQIGGEHYRAKSVQRVLIVDDAPKRKQRKPSAKPALVCTSLRLPKEVMDYFNTKHPYRKQAMMREVLADYVKANP